MSASEAVMTDAPRKEVDVQKALRVWQEYKKQHDLSNWPAHEAVGIDPETGEVWFGESALDIATKLEAQGVRRPLFFLRVGSDYYQRKGKRS
jgi:hypothetical protein